MTLSRRDLFRSALGAMLSVAAAVYVPGLLEDEPEELVEVYEIYNYKNNETVAMIGGRVCYMGPTFGKPSALYVSRVPDPCEW